MPLCVCGDYGYRYVGHVITDINLKMSNTDSLVAHWLIFFGNMTVRETFLRQVLKSRKIIPQIMSVRAI